MDSLASGRDKGEAQTDVKPVNTPVETRDRDLQSLIISLKNDYRNAKARLKELW